MSNNYTSYPIPDDWSGNFITPIHPDTAFNGYVAANVIFALEQLALWELLEHSDVSANDFIARHGLQDKIFRQLCNVAQDFGLITIESDTLSLTPHGKAISGMRGYFTWMIGGYRDLFGDAASVVRGAKVFGSSIMRDEAMVAEGAARNDASFMADTVDAVLAELDFSVIADLGSGNSARVCRVVKKNVGTRGLGLDISEPATALAELVIEKEGLGERVQAVQCDVLGVALDDVFRHVIAEVDVVMSFFLVHDLLRDRSTRSVILSRLRDVFPKAHTFVLADTVLHPHRVSERLPIFATGFELAHALMNVDLYTKEQYETMFTAAGFRLDRIIPFGTPNSWMFVLDANRQGGHD
jgi:hypothetical protein